MKPPHRMHCPNCSIEAQTLDVSFPNKDTVRIDGICPRCRKELWMETLLAQVLPNDGFDLEAWQPKGQPH